MKVGTPQTQTAALFPIARPAVAEVASPGPTLAPTGTYVTDEHHTSLTFRVSRYGLSNYTGGLTDVEAMLEWNTEEPAASTLIAIVRADSVETDNEGDTDFDGWIERSFLGAAETPEIRFTSAAVELTGDNTGSVTGDLSFHGETLPVVLDVAFKGAFS